MDSCGCVTEFSPGNVNGMERCPFLPQLLKGKLRGGTHPQLCMATRGRSSAVLGARIVGQRIRRGGGITAGEFPDLVKTSKNHCSRNLPTSCPTIPFHTPLSSEEAVTGSSLSGLFRQSQRGVMVKYNEQALESKRQGIEC